MAILTTTSLGGVAVYAAVDHDPTVIATDVPAGSLIYSTATGLLFQKLDDGATTNLARVSQAVEVIPVTDTLTLSKPSRNKVLDVDTSFGDVTVTLPTLAEARPTSDAGFLTSVRWQNGEGTLAVRGQGSELINGEIEVTIATRYTSLTFFPSATEWGILGVVFPDNEPTLRLIELVQDLSREVRLLRFQVDEMMGDTFADSRQEVIR